MKLVEPQDIFLDSETLPLHYDEGNMNGQVCLNHLPFLSRKFSKTTISNPYSIAVTGSFTCNDGTIANREILSGYCTATLYLKNGFDTEKNVWMSVEPDELNQNWYYSRGNQLKSRTKRWRCVQENQASTNIVYNESDVYMTALYYMERCGEERKAMKVLYSELYDLLSKKDFEKCDNYIDAFIKYAFGIKMFVAFMTITKPYKEKIQRRSKLYDALKTILNRSVPEKEAKNILSHVE